MNKVFRLLSAFAIIAVVVVVGVGDSQAAKMKLKVIDPTGGPSYWKEMEPVPPKPQPTPAPTPRRSPFPLKQHVDNPASP